MKNRPLTDLILLKNGPMATKVKVSENKHYIIYVKKKMTFTNTAKAKLKFIAFYCTHPPGFWRFFRKKYKYL